MATSSQIIPESELLQVTQKHGTLIFNSLGSLKPLTLKPDSPRTKEAILILGLEPNFYKIKFIKKI